MKRMIKEFTSLTLEDEFVSSNPPFFPPFSNESGYAKWITNNPEFGILED